MSRRVRRMGRWPPRDMAPPCALACAATGRFVRSRLRCGAQDGEEPVRRIEVLDGEGRVSFALTSAGSRGRGRAPGCGFLAEEGLERRRAAEPLVRTVDDVVHEGEFEPALEVVDGQRPQQAKPHRVLEGSPEALEPGGGVEVLGRGEALADAERRGRLDIVYLQAKKWDSTVGRPEIQKFVGALRGKRACKGAPRQAFGACLLASGPISERTSSTKWANPVSRAC